VSENVLATGPKKLRRRRRGVPHGTAAKARSTADTSRRCRRHSRARGRDRGATTAQYPRRQTQQWQHTYTAHTHTHTRPAHTHRLPVRGASTSSLNLYISRTEPYGHTTCTSTGRGAQARRNDPPAVIAAKRAARSRRRSSRHHDQGFERCCGTSLRGPLTPAGAFKFAAGVKLFP
jgi:hypothetical protein